MDDQLRRQTAINNDGRQNLDMTVEVFKTDVSETDRSELLIQQVLNHFPQSRVNFDMEDCDRILRVEGDTIKPDKIIEILTANGYLCEVLV